MSEEFWLIQENAPSAEVWGFSETEGIVFKGITMTTINHWKSDGFVSHVITNGTSTTKLLQERRPHQKPTKIKSTLFSEGFRDHARILALRGVERAWRESGAVYSTKLSDSQKKLERRLCSSKMSQQLELADFDRSSEHLPKSGMTVGGRVYLPQALGLHTKGNAGSYLPTPTAHPYKSNKGGAQGRVGKERFSLPYMWKMGLIPTLVVSQKGYDNQANGTRTLSLCGPWRATTGTTMPSSFCEWIMGYEIGHTKLNALGTQWFQCKSGKRLKSLAD